MLRKYSEKNIDVSSGIILYKILQYRDGKIL